MQKQNEKFSKAALGRCSPSPSISPRSGATLRRASGWPRERQPPNWRNVMSKLKLPAAFLVIGVMSLGVPAIAAPVTPLSAAATPMAQESELVQVRFGRWHGGWRRWHGLG